MLDLNRLTTSGVEIVGRLMGFRDGKATFSGSLNNVCAAADLKMNRLLDKIDNWIENHAPCGQYDPAERFEPTRVPSSPRLDVDVRNGGIRTIIWATGYRPDYSWLDVPVLDRFGHVRHNGGVTEAPGLYVMGLPFMRKRKSTLIDGAADDARDVSAHLASHLGGQRLAA
jgi:putative flavoprotein involved in K+ transport